MRRLKAVIASSQHELKSHPLFEALATAPSPEPLAIMARALAWWPMVFQDVLRLNLDRLRGSGFERFAEFHRSEDAGHDRWYLDDLGTFGVERPGLEELFGGPFQPLRETCYALVAEVLRDQSGAQRVALLLALEPTGHVFFERISAAVDRICPDLPLRYFGPSHLTVEKDHDLFAESTNAELERIRAHGHRARPVRGNGRTHLRLVPWALLVLDGHDERGPHSGDILRPRPCARGGHGGARCKRRLNRLSSR